MSLSWNIISQYHKESNKTKVKATIIVTNYVA